MARRRVASLNDRHPTQRRDPGVGFASVSPVGAAVAEFTAGPEHQLRWEDPDVAEGLAVEVRSGVEVDEVDSGA